MDLIFLCLLQLYYYSCVNHLQYVWYNRHNTSGKLHTFIAKFSMCKATICRTWNYINKTFTSLKLVWGQIKCAKQYNTTNTELTLSSKLIYTLPEKYGIFGSHYRNLFINIFESLQMALQQPEAIIATLMRIPDVVWRTKNEVRNAQNCRITTKFQRYVYSSIHGSLNFS